MLDADPDPSPPRPGVHPADARSPGGPPVWRAEELTGAGRQAHILLGEERYLLRITRAGKLILTK